MIEAIKYKGSKLQINNLQYCSLPEHSYDIAHIKFNIEKEYGKVVYDP